MGHDAAEVLPSSHDKTALVSLPAANSIRERIADSKLPITTPASNSVGVEVFPRRREREYTKANEANPVTVPAPVSANPPTHPPQPKRMAPTPPTAAPDDTPII